MPSANIFKDVRKEMKKLIVRAKEKGIYENFGQKEYLNLKDKWNRYIGVFSSESDKAINDKLDFFFKWCIDFDIAKLNNIKDVDEYVKGVV